MKNLLSLKYWFGVRPGDLMPQAQIAFIIICVVLLCLAFYAWQWKKNNPKNLYRKVFLRIETFAITNFLIGLVLLFFEYEAVPILSMRFWALLWLVSMGVWKWFIYKDYQNVPIIKQQIAESQKLKKYIP